MDERMDIDEFLKPVQELVKGCESFVNSTVSGMTTQINKEMQTLNHRLNEHEQNKERETKEKDDLLKRLQALEIRDKANPIQHGIVTKLEQKLTTTEKRVSDLEGQLAIKQVDTCRCAELFSVLTTVGNAVLAGGEVSLTNGADTVTLLHAPSAYQTTPPVSLPDHHTYTNTPCSTSIGGPEMQTELSYGSNDPYVEHYSSVPHMVKPKKSATVAVYKTMDDLPSDFRKILIRHHTPKSPLGTKKKLSDLQRTYVEYFVDSNPKISSPSELAKQCIARGVDDRIWTSEFNQREDGISTFYDYFYQRIKNKAVRSKKSSLKMKMKDLVKSQASRLGKESE